jgi:hypothetical protein
MLESEGVRVEWEPPLEQRSAEHVEAIVLGIIGSGTYDAMKVALQTFRDRSEGEAVMEGDEDDD